MAATLIKVHHIGLFKWEAIVDDDRCLYFYQAFTRWGAKRQADSHVTSEQ